MISFISVGVGYDKGGDAQNFGEDVVGQAAAHGRDEQGFYSLSGGDPLANRAGEERVKRGLGGGHAALADDLDLGSVALYVGFDLGKDLLRRLGFNQADVTLG